MMKDPYTAPKTTKTYDWDGFKSDEFWSHYKTSDEFSDVRKRMKMKSVKLLNQEIMERTVVYNDLRDQADEEFREMKMTGEALEKIVQMSRQVNDLLGYESEIKMDLADTRTHGGTQPVVRDVHVTYNQKIAPSSVHSNMGKDPYLREILEHYGQTRVGIGHSHGPHRCIHSTFDDDVLRSYLEHDALRKDIKIWGNGKAGVTISIPYLPSLIVNGRTVPGYDKEGDHDYHVTIGVKVPFFTGKGLMVDQIYYNRTLPLRISEEFNDITFRPDLINAQIADRVEIEQEDGLYVRLIDSSRVQDRLKRSLRTPLALEPNFRKRTHEMLDSYHGSSIKDLLKKKRSKTIDSIMKESEEAVLEKNEGLISRIGRNLRNWFSREQKSQWDDQTRKSLRDIMKVAYMRPR